MHSLAMMMCHVFNPDSFVWFFASSLRILPIVKIVLIQPLEGSGDGDVFNS